MLSTSSNLTQYSDAQLKQMVSSGEITQGEYNTEIASRAAAKKQEEEASVSNANKGTTKVDATN